MEQILLHGNMKVVLMPLISRYAIKKRPYWDSVKAFTLIEVLVVLVIMVIAMRFVMPSLARLYEPNGSPDAQWMTVLYRAQKEAKQTDSWLELLPGRPVQARRWNWDSQSRSWKTTSWKMPVELSEEALAYQPHTPFPEHHFWIAPLVGAIPYVQALCASLQCVLLTPAGDVMKGNASDIRYGTSP